MNGHEETMMSEAWARFREWLPRPLSDGDIDAITDLCVTAGETGQEPDYRAMLAAVRDNPGTDLRNVEAYFSGEWCD